MTDSRHTAMLVIRREDFRDSSLFDHLVETIDDADAFTRKPAYQDGRQVDDDDELTIWVKKAEYVEAD